MIEYCNLGGALHEAILVANFRRSNACVFSSCAVVPPHDGMARVRVDDVVKRVKCDIATAVLEKTNVAPMENILSPS
jgi:hypothetical protein